VSASVVGLALDLAEELAVADRHGEDPAEVLDGGLSVSGSNGPPPCLSARLRTPTTKFAVRSGTERQSRSVLIDKRPLQADLVELLAALEAVDVDRFRSVSARSITERRWA
jgi:hypothetical protein